MFLPMPKRPCHHPHLSGPCAASSEVRNGNGGMETSAPRARSLQLAVRTMMRAVVAHGHVCFLVAYWRTGSCGLDPDTSDTMFRVFDELLSIGLFVAIHTGDKYFTHGARPRLASSMSQSTFEHVWTPRDDEANEVQSHSTLTQVSWRARVGSDLETGHGWRAPESRGASAPCHNGLAAEAAAPGQAGCPLPSTDSVSTPFLRSEHRSCPRRCNDRSAGS